MKSDGRERLEPGVPDPPDISDDDVYEAMKEIHGYLDITPGDFKRVYLLAFRHAFERLGKSQSAKDIMTKEVVAVTEDTPLKEVARLMARHRISGVPVLDKENKVAGVVSEKDFLKRMGEPEEMTFMAVVSECLEGSGCLAVGIRGKKASDIMSSPGITVGEDTPVLEIGKVLGKGPINRVPVVDEKGRLIGMVSRADLVRNMC
ncbi:MAG: CBS domain-containing protein [Deltaproteobacteria bacterium]|nr:CBS domain-containing protein [Deltaproteobacteria bacterium]MBW2066362.1 CBS domain-containing protein [Deltaproteobacteria bacterium]